MTPAGRLSIIVFGAHPDDCDIKAGGTAALWTKRGDTVKFVSVTNGDAGHHEMSGEELAARRRQEAKEAGDVIGIEYEVLNNHDGCLIPDLKSRLEIIRLIREAQPDLVLSPRPNDYHPDHRYTAQLVQDAAYMVTVPNICPEVPALKKNPVICYLSDHFLKPAPFSPDVLVNITDVFDEKVRMIHCHTSQMYEWLPWHAGNLDEVPEGEEARLAWLTERNDRRFTAATEPWRQRLTEIFGPEKAGKIKYAEAFEVCEYGSPLTDEKADRFFGLT